MADNENETLVAETQKTDDDKADIGANGEETAKETKYDSDEFETESESSVAKTDEEKCAEKNKEDSPVDEDKEVKTDDEKLGNDLKEEQGADTDTIKDNGESVVNTETDKTTEMSETGETKTEERFDEQQEEQSTVQEQTDATVEGEAVPDSPKQEDEAKPDQATSEKETEEKANEVEVDKTGETPENEDKNESAPVDDNKEDKEAVPVPSGAPIDKEELDSRIKENEDLSLKLESSLSNQEAERAAYMKLTDENAKLQKRHDDMKEKFEEMEGGHVLLVAEVETLRKVNQEQKETIVKLESEIKLLKETQGGDANVKDMQEKLIRMSNEQEDKDRRIHSLEGELDATREKLNDAESRAARGGNNTAQNSKTCIIM